MPTVQSSRTKCNKRTQWMEIHPSNTAIRVTHRKTTRSNQQKNNQCVAIYYTTYNQEKEDTEHQGNNIKHTQYKMIIKIKLTADHNGKEIAD